jgi:hypothetical protein
MGGVLHHPVQRVFTNFYKIAAKATVSFIISLGRPVCMEQLYSNWTDFQEILTGDFLKIKSVKVISFV